MAGSPGLRERKQRETRTRIERAAVELVLAHGYDAVSVDMICDRVDISPRTFFNYFGTKELAVLGEMPRVSSEQFAAFESSTRDDVLADLLDLASVAIGESDMVRSSLTHERRLVLKSNPELLLTVSARMERQRSAVIAAVEVRLHRLHEQAPLDDGELGRDALMLFELVAACVKFVVHRSVSTEATEAEAVKTLRARFEEARALCSHILAPGASFSGRRHGGGVAEETMGFGSL